MRISSRVGQMPNNYIINGNKIQNTNGQNIAIGQGKDSALEGIQNQIYHIQKQLLSLSENDKLSAEEKLERQKELQEQLEQLNKMLLEQKMEIEKKEEEKKTKAINEELEKQLPQDEYIKGMNFEDFQNFVCMRNSLKLAEEQGSLRTKLKGEAKVLESEIKLDESRGADTIKKREKLRVLSTKIDKINFEISESMDKVAEEIKKNISPQDKDEEEIQEDRHLQEPVDIHV